jgi:hypothetical protein
MNASVPERIKSKSGHCFSGKLMRQQNEKAARFLPG